jgi:hypothetical protein
VINGDRSGRVLYFGEMPLRLSSPAVTRLKSASSLDVQRDELYAFDPFAAQDIQR